MITSIKYFIKESNSNKYRILDLFIENDHLLELYNEEDIVVATGSYDKITYSDNKKYTTIWNINVDENYRNLGIGKIFMTKLIELLKPKVDIIYLQVKHENNIAIKLYESFGFKIYKNMSFYYCMKKEL